MEGTNKGRSPGPAVQDVLSTDAIGPPEVLLREYPPEFSDNLEISIDRYLSQEWHDLEVEHIWQKVWQMACRSRSYPMLVITLSMR